MDDDNHKKNENQENVSNQSGKSIIKYLESEDKSYYVLDTPNEEDIKKLERLDYLFILESPHTDEVIKEHPLAGDSGKAVTKFLLGKDEKQAFGEIVRDSYSSEAAAAKRANSQLNNKKIAIVNVSNVPLQVIEANKEATKDIVGLLESIRKNSIAQDNFGSVDLFKKFKTKLATYCDCKKFNDEATIVVCGEFAKKYFNKFLLGDKNLKIETNTDLLQRICDDKIQILYVPHPSRNQWQFIDRHRENLNTLKNQF